MAIYAYIRTACNYNGMADQESAMLGHAIACAYRIDECFRDIGISGLSPPFTRPAWQSLMEQLKPGDTLLISNYDRIARDPKSLAPMLEILRDKRINLDLVHEDR
jgi:DNA invertase Pin-like site-specific DNA recombinase